MVVDPKSAVPVYLQIVQQVCSAIEAGIYRAGESLPSQRTLAVELRVNPNTVQRAFDELLRDGVIESRRGRGVFVVDRRRMTPRGVVEKSCEAMLAKTIQGALDGGMTPARLRELFEVALRESLSTTRSHA
jgi:GntR family transcriptional regulator